MGNRESANVSTICWRPAPGADAPDRSASGENTNVIAPGLRSLSVYACHREIAEVEKYPALEDSSISYPLGNDSRAPTSLKRGKDRIGQAGWNVGLTYKDLGDLEMKLREGVVPSDSKDHRPIGRGEIWRLAISAHGGQGGVWFPNGLGAQPDPDSRTGLGGLFWAPITAQRRTIDLKRSMHPKAKDGKYPSQSVADISEWLYKIGLYTREGSTIILMGCSTGGGDDGTELLVELARIWPLRKIVAFSTVGMLDVYWMTKKGDSTKYLAGMKDTDCPDYDIYKTREVQLQTTFPILPWASEQSKNAKIVVNYGVKKPDFRVLNSPLGESCPKDGVYVPRPAPPPQPQAVPKTPPPYEPSWVTARRANQARPPAKPVQKVPKDQRGTVVPR
jgi:hypothetical protein